MERLQSGLKGKVIGSIPSFTLQIIISKKLLSKKLFPQNNYSKQFLWYTKETSPERNTALPTL